MNCAPASIEFSTSYFTQDDRSVITWLAQTCSETVAGNFDIMLNKNIYIRLGESPIMRCI
jgi:hypothetical protein